MRPRLVLRRVTTAALLLNLLLVVNASAQSCPVNQTLQGSVGPGDEVQTGRLIRDPPPSDCGPPKTFPGLVDETPRRFDQYTFTNNSASAACIQVTIDPQSCTGANEIFSAAYLTDFNPTDLSQNYLADSGNAGSAGTPFSYSFTVPAGATFVVVVNEIDPDAGCAAYTLSVGCGVPPAAAGQVLISEFRLSGPDGGTLDGRDEFIELYNNTDAPVSISRNQIRAFNPNFGGDFTIELPAGATIPARGHYLVGDSGGYSLSGYATLDFDLNLFEVDVFLDNEGFQLIGPPGNQIVIDSVGFTGGGNAGTYVEGTGLTRRSSTPVVQYSYVRKLYTGRPQDTNNNAADFALISVTGETFSEAGPTMLGAPGPENRASPINRTGAILAQFLDPSQAQGAEPNRVRNTNPVPNGPLGTLSVQRRFFNNTGVPVTRLRLRFVDITTLNSPGYTNPGQADLRVLSSTGVVTRADGSTVVTVIGTTLEQPPNQPNGGGYNSTLAVATITTNTPLMPGDSIELQSLAGVVRGGSFRFLVIIEATP